MNEKLFKKIKRSGSGALVAGIIILCVGITTGILSIVSGAKMLAAKSDTLF